MIFEDSLKLIKPLNNSHYIPEFEYCFKLFITPYYNSLIFMKEMHCAFFYKLALKKALMNENGYLETYEAHIRRNGFFILQLFVGINMAFAIVLSFSFLLLNFYFVIFILLISLPFKLYPLKFILGIGFSPPKNKKKYLYLIRHLIKLYLTII